MFIGIANTPRPYAWGSTTAIAELLGRDPSGEPEAELWLGSHPGSPAEVIDPRVEASDLSELVELPFLLKVLAAAAPLSLQAHPTLEQARAGFDRENALGIPIDAAHRNYKDPLHKPELIFALSERFDALCGFRPAEETERLLRTIQPEPSPLDELVNRLGDLRDAFEWLISGGPDVDALVGYVTRLAADDPRSELDTVRMLAAQYPNDPGIVISLLLNRVTLDRGEVLYLPAGNIHAYLGGLGIELMAASDNVLRGGLTPKHVDVPELLRVLDFTPLPVPYLRPERLGEHLAVYRPDVPDFALVHVTGEASLEITGPSIALVTAGRMLLEGRDSSAELARGQAALVTPDEGELRISGAGEMFLAVPGGPS